MERRPSEKQRGQAAVEMAFIVPVLLVMVLGMTEFSLLFRSYLTVMYAAREGARVGSSFGDGSGFFGRNHNCDAGSSYLTDQSSPYTDYTVILPTILGTLQQLDQAQIKKIYVFQVINNADGTMKRGKLENRYVYDAKSPTRFKMSTASGDNKNPWNPCLRVNASADSLGESIGVGVSYDHKFIGVLPMLTTLSIYHEAVMRLEPQRDPGY